jgi:hypothetical protein
MERSWTMKLYRTFLLVVLVVMPLMAPRTALAANWLVSVSVGQVNDFYAPLSRHGYWVEMPSYGRCWYPAYVEHDWRPYTEGYWLWTDGGWYWVSEEPWAWATYHYGRWVLDSYYGWVWVPDTVWGPAWVGWRGGGEYIGWAPLPPRCGFGPDGWLITGGVVIAPQWFVFVQYGHFCEPIHRRHVIIDEAIVNRTANITSIRRVDHTTINHGPDLDAVQRHIGHKLEARPVGEIRQAETEWRKGQGSLSRAKVKLPSPILPVAEEQGREGRKLRETAVGTTVIRGSGAAVRTESLSATRPVPGPADVIIPRREQPQALRSAVPDRLERNAASVGPLPGNYGNFPTGKAYGKPRGDLPSAPEIAQPRAPGARMPLSDDPNWRKTDRSSGRDRD